MEKSDVFKKKASWPLRQLKVFDAKYVTKVWQLVRSSVNNSYLELNTCFVFVLICLIQTVIIL